MKHSVTRMMAVLAAGIAMTGASPAASAQAAGQWTAYAGAARISPKVESGDLSQPSLPGSRAGVGRDTGVVFGAAYGLTDNVSVELDLGLPFKHKLYGAGALAGMGELGTVKVLPPTVLWQYRWFAPDAAVRPYAGFGATWAEFMDETGSAALTALSGGTVPVTFSVKDKLAATAQLGVTLRLDARWYADLALLKTRLRTRVAFSTGHSLGIALDPAVAAIALGYRF